MDECDEVEKNLLERIQCKLEADPELYDVTFSVGPQKTKVNALKIILMAASPVFTNEFKTKRKNVGVKCSEEILLPEFEGDMFQLFVNLTSLDTWSVDILSNMNLPPNQLLDLLFICRRYEMRTAVKSLKKLTASFIQAFAKFKDTADFLKLSQANLKEVFASDDLPLEEMEVLKSALKWAEWQCKEKKIEESVGNLRHVLGNCLFEIRFLTMSNVEFTNAMEMKELLSAEETLKIYKYVGSGDSKRQHFDARSLGFNARRRSSVLSPKQESNSAALESQTQLTPGVHKATQTIEVKASPSVQPKETPTPRPLVCCMLSLLSESRKIDVQTPFVCDGSLHKHEFRSEQYIAVVGLGFVGPSDADAFYDVTVEISGASFTDGIIKKRIFALKGQTFYFLFDEPITVEEFRFSSILYSLKGPETPSIEGGEPGANITLQEGSFVYDWFFDSNQLSEMLFKRL